MPNSATSFHTSAAIWPQHALCAAIRDQTVSCWPWAAPAVHNGRLPSKGVSPVMPDSLVHQTDAASAAVSRAYLSGFGNEVATEAVPGALPVGQNSPQRPPLGLYAESISGTPFTAPRHANRRTWFYRIRPSADHPPFRRRENGLLRSGPFDEAEPPANRLRWS